MYSYIRYGWEWKYIYIWELALYATLTTSRRRWKFSTKNWVERQRTKKALYTWADSDDNRERQRAPEREREGANDKPMLIPRERELPRDWERKSEEHAGLCALYRHLSCANVYIALAIHSRSAFECVCACEREREGDRVSFVQITIFSIFIYLLLLFLWLLMQMMVLLSYQNTMIYICPLKWRCSSLQMSSSAWKIISSSLSHSRLCSFE